MAIYRTDLSRETVAAILDYSPATGIFRWRFRPLLPKTWNTRCAGTIAGQISNGYRCIQVAGKGAYYAARLAWLLHYGVWPQAQIDHINGVRDDDRIINLREANNAQNNQNRAAQRNNIDGARGLSLHPTAGWRVRLMARGVAHDLGYFQDRAEALAARKSLEDRLHADFAPTTTTAHGTYSRKSQQITDPQPSGSSGGHTSRHSGRLSHCRHDPEQDGPVLGARRVHRTIGPRYGKSG